MTQVGRLLACVLLWLWPWPTPQLTTHFLGAIYQSEVIANKFIHSLVKRGKESGLPRMTRPEDGIGMWVQLTTSMQTPKPVEQTRFTRIQYCTVTKDLATLNSTIKQGFFDPFPCLPTFRDTEFTSWLSN
ncbi:uncharacterized protein B0J16DRAFT_157927 [Fusarium flagelliforme]|uniref:uncharacterized protein n=1 Tax=Fusarium flagelliforme TaxID=2675880 RepID=UPI001E8E6B4E|nr:uncharacterized protein B0J16DRAFT_157927 [Fusarium flagelliforme]KAH7182942.1 hypothetical protein B0J16DRAFT_157927 [Fusarium flagelliforme]